MEDETLYWPFEKPVRAPHYDLDGKKLSVEDFTRFYDMIAAYDGPYAELPGIVQRELELIRNRKDHSSSGDER